MKPLPSAIKLTALPALLILALTLYDSLMQPTLDKTCVDSGRIALKANPIDGLYLPADIQRPKSLWKCADGRELVR